MSRRSSAPPFALAAFLLVSFPSSFGQSPANPVADSPKPSPYSATDLAALAEAKQLYRSGKYNDALQKYQDLLKQPAPLPEAFSGLTRTYLKQEKVAEAFDTAQKGLRGTPDSSPLHVALGEVYFRQGNMAAAEREWIAVVSKQLDARALLGLARLSESFSSYRRAKAVIDKAHELDPTDPEIQSFWTSTLKLSEKISLLESDLASANNDDVETRKHKQHYLEILKARTSSPQGRCRLTTKLVSTETDLKPIMSNPREQAGYGLNVILNGQKALLLLDTGAGGITVDRKIAEKAGIKLQEEGITGGIGDQGGVRSWNGYVDSVQIGNLKFQDCIVDVIDKGSVLDDDGLIGADVFSDFLVDIDFPDRKLKLSELPKRPEGSSMGTGLRTGNDDRYSEEDPSAKEPKSLNTGPQDAYVAPEMTAYTHIFRFGHFLLIPTKVSDASPKLFAIDTGAFQNTIAPEAAREVTKITDNPHYTVRGLSGEVENVLQADKVVLQFGHLKQENQAIVSHDLSGISRHIGTEVSGLLGFNLLSILDLKIDYRDGLVNFTYVPKPKIEPRQF